MCVAMPAKILKIYEDKALVKYGTINREINISLLESIHVNDYVLVHAGFAINKIDEREAKETLKLFEEMAELSDVRCIK